MATGALNAQGVWIYGEDDSETTFSALLNKLGTSVSSNMKGRIAQVVTGATVTSVTNSTTSFVDTTLTATITPTSINSRILVFVSQTGLFKSNGSSSNGIWLNLLKNGATVSVFGTAVGLNFTAQSAYLGEASTLFQENPGTTSAITYKTQFRNETAASLVQVQASSSNSRIILVEVTA
jgi:hypothetical protein